jgi:uncharacterized protein YdcH (DUF465 family)
VQKRLSNNPQQFYAERKTPLLHKLPEHRDTIHDFKMTNNHFARLFDEYYEIHRIETGVENTSYNYLEERKKIPLHLKDELYRMIIDVSISVQTK